MTIIPSVYVSEGQSFAVVSVKDFNKIKEMKKEEAVKYLVSLEPHIFISAYNNTFLSESGVERKASIILRKGIKDAD